MVLPRGSPFFATNPACRHDRFRWFFRRIVDSRHFLDAFQHLFSLRKRWPKLGAFVSCIIHHALEKYIQALAPYHWPDIVRMVDLQERPSADLELSFGDRSVVATACSSRLLGGLVSKISPMEVSFATHGSKFVS